jgi:hypothetical protein
VQRRGWRWTWWRPTCTPTARTTASRCGERDWLAPARNVPRVWLGGISRGGQLALSCWAGQVGAVDGLCLLAPYPGRRITTNAIERAGGLARWQPEPTTR